MSASMLYWKEEIRYWKGKAEYWSPWGPIVKEVVTMGGGGKMSQQQRHRNIKGLLGFDQRGVVDP